MALENVLLFVACLLTAGSAFFFPMVNLPNQRQSMMNVCIYSVNPTRYQPKCFLCPSNVYSNMLRTCVNAAAIPSNISYTQAACIEQNCQIGRGKRSVYTRPLDVQLLEKNNSVVQQQDNRDDRLLQDHDGDDEQMRDVGQSRDALTFLEFFASDYGEDYEYADG